MTGGLERHAELFCLMVPERAADGLGGTLTVWSPGETFSAAVVWEGCAETTRFGRRAARETIRLYYDRDMDLTDGDRVERVRDGSVFRVTGEGVPAPEASGWQVARVDAERMIG